MQEEKEKSYFEYFSRERASGRVHELSGESKNILFKGKKRD